MTAWFSGFHKSFKPETRPSHYSTCSGSFGSILLSVTIVSRTMSIQGNKTCIADDIIREG